MVMSKRDRILRSLGQSVAKHRRKKNLTQDVLAEKADLDRTYLSDIERGVRNPGLKNVAIIAKALGLTTAELCKGVDVGQAK
jgi:transcriptional regulator with XRE-family HTH domain